MTPKGTGLLVLVPSRGRPHAVAEMAKAFNETCGAYHGGEHTKLLFVVDGDDPTAVDYMFAAQGQHKWAHADVFTQPGGSMVAALNAGAAHALTAHPSLDAIGFMGDDHRPRSEDWDTAYLDALRAVPGLVYGNDLFQGERLPTQVAMSIEVVRALGAMAPQALTHLFVDNYWLTLGRAANCITYLPDVVVEHLHPVANKAAWDEGYQRVNAHAMYERDRAAFNAHMLERGEREILAVRSALAGAAA